MFIECALFDRSSRTRLTRLKMKRNWSKHVQCFWRRSSQAEVPTVFMLLNSLSLSHTESTLRHRSWTGGCFDSWTWQSQPFASKASVAANFNRLPFKRLKLTRQPPPAESGEMLFEAEVAAVWWPSGSLDQWDWNMRLEQSYPQLTGNFWIWCMVKLGLETWVSPS